MTGQRSSPGTGSDSPTETSRRRLVAGVGVGIAGVLGGCAGALGENAPGYEDGSAVDVEGEDRAPEEVTAADALAEQELNEGVTELDELTLETHEFVLEDDFRGSTVQGTLTNTGSDRIQLAEVRVRVANAEGEHLGRYLATTGDLEPDSTWAFEVIVLESPDDIASYEITGLGTPT